MTAPHARATGPRPEFTALLEQLRASAGGRRDPGELGRHSAPADRPDDITSDGEPLIPEPIAAEAAWLVVERLDAQQSEPQHEPDAAQPHVAPPSRPVDAQDDLIETVRQQAQAAIDEAFSAAGLAEEAERMARAASTIPMPRRTAREQERALDEHSAAMEQLVTDKATLRMLGVPPAWIRRMRGGDRFADVWQALEPMPAVDIDADAAVVAVVGPEHAVRLEAHRVAIDLASGTDPRPVVNVPAAIGARRAAALAKAARSAPCVVAIQAEPGSDPALVQESVAAAGASVVIVMVDATLRLETAQAWLDALGAVDAICLDGVGRAELPMQMLQLGIPVTRLDEIPIDRATWTALLCAQLEAASPAR